MITFTFEHTDEKQTMQTVHLPRRGDTVMHDGAIWRVERVVHYSADAEEGRVEAPTVVVTKIDDVVVEVGAT